MEGRAAPLFGARCWDLTIASQARSCVYTSAVAPEPRGRRANDVTGLLSVCLCGCCVRGAGHGVPAPAACLLAGRRGDRAHEALLGGLPDGETLTAFLPAFEAEAWVQLRCRRAIASTLLAGLEWAARLCDRQQEAPSAAIRMRQRRRRPADPAPSA